jgi:phosphohistidine phosphatase
MIFCNNKIGYTEKILQYPTIRVHSNSLTILHTVWLIKMTKTIYLARHAKSAWDTAAPTDFDRPLSNRGMDDAIAMGKALNFQSWKPEKIISSPALRAQLTCLAYCEYLDFDTNLIHWQKEHYAAYMVTLLQCLTNLPETLNSVMLLGHNPAMEDLLIHLCGDLSDYRQQNGKLFTTGNIARLSTKGKWRDLIMGEAIMIQLLRPKEL